MKRFVIPAALFAFLAFTGSAFAGWELDPAHTSVQFRHSVCRRLSRFVGLIV